MALGCKESILPLSGLGIIINVNISVHTKEKGTFGYRARLFQELIYFEDLKGSLMLPSSLVNPVSLPVK